MNRSVLVLLLLLLLGTPPVTQAEGWLTYQNNTDNTGYTRSDAPRENATVKWTYDTKKEVVASPVVSDGNAYIGTLSSSYFGTVYMFRQFGIPYEASMNQTGNLYSIDTVEGGINWTRSVNGSVWATPVIDDGTVYAGTLAGKLYAVDEETGETEWKFDADEPVFSLTASDNRVYVGTRDRNSHDNYSHRRYPFYALDGSSGNVIWKTGLEEGVFASPAVTGNRVYVGDNNGTLHALNTSDGRTVWSFETEGDDFVQDDPLVKSGGVTSAPTVSDDTVYFGNYVGNVYAVNRSNGHRRWNYSIEGEPTSTLIATSPAFADGTVYIGSYDNSLYALNALTGDYQWSFPAEGQIKESSPVVAEDTVYFGSKDGYMYALDAADGGEVWSYYTGSDIHSSPAVSEGSLYFTSLDGVHAVEEDRSGEPLPQQSSDDSTGGEETTQTHAEPERDVPMGALYLLLLSFGTVSVMAVAHVYYRRCQRGTDR
jgi:outer membrane protein assembly factor BamB